MGINQSAPITSTSSSHPASLPPPSSLPSTLPPPPYTTDPVDQQVIKKRSHSDDKDEPPAKGTKIEESVAKDDTSTRCSLPLPLPLPLPPPLKRLRDDDDDSNTPSKKTKTDECVTTSDKILFPFPFPLPPTQTSLKRVLPDDDDFFFPQGKRARMGKSGRTSDTIPPPGSSHHFIKRPILGPHHRSAKAKKPAPFQFLVELPFELRQIVFDNCMEWTGRSPVILRALRCNRLLYPEAIKHFYKMENTFYLNQRNGWSFCKMSTKALESITKIKIEIKEYRPNPRVHHHANITVPKPRKISKLYCKVPNLREVILEGRLGTVTDPAIMMMSTEYIRNAKNLRSFDVDFRFLRLTSPEKQRLMSYARDVHLQLGVQGVQNATEELRRKKRAQIESAVWWWDAEEGKCLKPIVRGP